MRTGDETRRQDGRRRKGESDAPPPSQPTCAFPAASMPNEYALKLKGEKRRRTYSEAKLLEIVFDSGRKGGGGGGGGRGEKEKGNSCDEKKKRWCCDTMAAVDTHPLACSFT